MRLLCLAAVVAAASTSTELFAQSMGLPNPISSPGAPWHFAGFIVNSPVDSGWESYYKTLNAAAMTKVGRDPGRKYVLLVTLLAADEKASTSDEFASYFKSNRAKAFGYDEKSMASRMEKGFSHQGQLCSRYQLSVKRGRSPLGLEPNAFVQIGMTCMHPDRKDRAVDVSYVELGSEQEASETIRQVGDKFVESLRFFSTRESLELANGRDLVRSGSYEELKRLLRPLADSGDKVIARFLGVTLLHDSKISEDHALAIGYLELAATDGYVDALYNLGVAYDKGLGVKRNLDMAIKWFKLAADQRDGQSQLNLGILHHPRGNGVVKDLEIAESWFRLAADNGNQRARQILQVR